MFPTLARHRQELLGIKERSRSFEQVATIDTADANLEYAGENGACRGGERFRRFSSAACACGLHWDRLLDSRIDVGEQQAFAILISDELWRRRFAADPGVIGRAVRDERCRHADRRCAACRISSVFAALR